MRETVWMRNAVPKLYRRHGMRETVRMRNTVPKPYRRQGMSQWKTEGT